MIFGPLFKPLKLYTILTNDNNLKTTRDLIMDSNKNA